MVNPKITPPVITKKEGTFGGHAEYDSTDGAAGFSPQYSGNGIAGLNNTSSFDVSAGTPTALPPPKVSKA